MTIKSFALSTLLLVSVSVSAFAAGNNPVASQADEAGIGAGRTRAEVVAELKQAIANGEITHNPLDVIYELTENHPQRTAIAREEGLDKPVQDLSRLQIRANKNDVK